MTYSSSEHSADEPGDNLERQARTAWDTYRQELRRLTERGESPRKLCPRRVCIPRWTVKAARRLQADPGSTDAVVEKTTGGHMAAAVLSQSLYWLLGFRKDGTPRAHPPEPERGLDHRWFATTAAELARQIGARQKQVEPCLVALRANRWLAYHPMRYRGRGMLRGLVVSHIWLDYQSRHMLAEIQQAGNQPPAMTLNVWAMHGTGGDINAALLLSQLWYRAIGKTKHGKPVGRSHDSKGGPRYGTLKIDNDDLSEWLMLSPTQLKRARATLRERNLLLDAPHGLVRLNIEFCKGLVVMSRSEHNSFGSSTETREC